jgi:hypothetical protein
MSFTPLYVSNPEQWLDETVKADMVGLVIFSGSYSKFDRVYLRKLGHFIKQKQENGDSIKLIAWTSGGTEDAKKADEEWGLTKECGYSAVIGDDTAALAKYLIEDELLPNLVIAEDPKKDANIDNLPTSGAGQIWWAHRGTVCFEWSSKVEDGPNRPDPDFVFDQVTKRKHALEHGNAIMPVHGDDIKMCTCEEVDAAGCSML